MEKINYKKNENNNKTGVKTYAEYDYLKRTDEGNKIVCFRTNYISTIDIPYARYRLK